MDRADIAAMQPDRIPTALAGGPSANRWNELEKQAGGHAAQLLRLVCRVDPPTRIAELRNLESGQGERGAGFLGMLPDQIPDDLETPTDLESALVVSIHLAKIRAANLAALGETIPTYPLAFLQGSPGIPTPDPIPDGWRLDIDLEGIRAILDFLDAEDADEATAHAIARMPAFVEMMRHRRDLGYVPEPLIDEDGLAWCLVHAASRDPIDELWKWLHPHNLFDLSDLFTHRADYRRLVDVFSDGGRLAAFILGAIAPYAPPRSRFVDRLSFAVGWGIRGWATEATGGVNIEHGKDDFASLLPTLIHETYHRLQAAVAYPNPEVAKPGFERITSYPFDDVRDRRMYGALCYVMLEGSATYVADPKPVPDWDDALRTGVALLESVETLDSEEDDASDEILNEGLRSNGPFYGFGALLSHALVEDGGPSHLGIALQRGAPFFIARGLALLGNSNVMPSEAVGARIGRLRASLEPDVSSSESG